MVLIAVALLLAALFFPLGTFLWLSRKEKQGFRCHPKM
jgi:nitrogen fixation-related uncharacterized protein